MYQLPLLGGGGTGLRAAGGGLLIGAWIWGWIGVCIWGWI